MSTRLKCFAFSALLAAGAFPMVCGLGSPAAAAGGQGEGFVACGALLPANGADEERTGQEAGVADSLALEEDTVMTMVEEKASFPGGREKLYMWLGENLNYPAEALKKRVQGVVMVRFVVKKNGKIGEIKIIKSLDPDCDREVRRLIRKMPDWIPGRYEGKPVTSYFVLPVIFAL